MSITIQDVLTSLPDENKSRKVILPDITGHVVMSAIRRLKKDGYNPVICGTKEELRLYSDDITHGLEYFEVPKGENKLIFAAQKVFEGRVYGFLGGNNVSTGETVGSILQARKSLDMGKTRLSSHFLSEIGGRIIILADCALLNHNSVEGFVTTVEQSIEAAKKYGIETPSVAMLSFATLYPELNEGDKGYVDHISLMQQAIKTIKEKLREDYPIEGPCQLDAVMNEETAKKKNPDSIFCKSRPDILIYPSLEAGNISYKTFNLMGAQTLGPILSGTHHDLSRSATEDDIYNSVIMNIL